MGSRKSKVRYCNECQRRVTPIRIWGWGGFFIFGLLYLPYYWLMKDKVCPICYTTIEDD